MEQHFETPMNFDAVKDGKTDATGVIVAALNYAHTNGIADVTFPPGDYLLTGTQSIHLYSDTFYRMDGARFIVRHNTAELFYVFEMENACNTKIIGGEIIGDPDWSRHNLDRFAANTKDYINIGGLHIHGGGTENVEVKGFAARDLTAAGILVISRDERPVCGVRIIDCNIVRASPNYADYLTEKPPGALAGEDWDPRANIFVTTAGDVKITDCTAAESHCDGITLEKCKNASLTDCAATDQHMGGIVLIGGRDITIKNCSAKGNGSRGFTVEAECENASLTNCKAAANGREGCWIDRGCQAITLTDINFTENGRKSDLVSTATYPGNKTAHIRITNGHSGQKNTGITITDCRFTTYNQLCSVEVEADSLEGGPVMIAGCTVELLPKTGLPDYPARESVKFEQHINAQAGDVVLSGNTRI